MAQRRSAPPKRSQREWVKRGGAALLVLVINVVIVGQSLAEALARRTPSLAYAIAPLKGQIAAALADAEFKANPNANPDSTASRFAIAALRTEPTAVKAVAVLGLQAQMRNQTDAARRYFNYSERLSRRNFVTQLWGVEDAVARGDVEGALRHYDIALRTTLGAQDVMFPVLVSAISDVSIRTALTKTLSQKPDWTSSFIRYLVENGSDPRSIGALYTDLRQAGLTIPPEADEAVIRRFLAEDAADNAWRYYASVRSGVDARRSRDPRFAAPYGTPTAFDWTPSKDPNLGASFQRRAEGGVFDFATLSGVSGVLLQQVQMIPPGRYRLQGHSIGIKQGDAARPVWTLTCKGGAELARLSVPNSTQANGYFAATVSVPAGCSPQILALKATSSDRMESVTGQFDLMQIVPVN